MLDKFKDEEERSLSVVQCVSRARKNHVDNVFVTICAWCKRIRDDEGFWHKTMEFCHGDSGEKITHGICPECMRKERLVLAKKNQLEQKHTIGFSIF